jgi:hypothetical protein
VINEEFLCFYKTADLPYVFNHNHHYQQPSNFSLDSIKIIENYIDINNITVKSNTTNSNDSNTMNSNEAVSSWKTYNQNQCPTILKLRGLPYNQPWWQEQDNIRNYLESNIEIITNEFMHLYNHPCHLCIYIIDIWHPYLTASLIHELTIGFHNFSKRKNYSNDDDDDDDDDDTNINNNKHNQHDCNYAMKAVVIGNRCVGKSKFIMRACNDKFDDSYSFHFSHFESSLIAVQNKIIKMRIWDYSSPERYHAMSSSYYRLANVIFVLCESTESIHICSFWINEIKKFAPEESIIIIVRSKWI